MTDIDLELNAGPPLADPMLDSLYRRMRTMHSLYYQAVDTMDLEHVNHFEREGVLPIAFGSAPARPRVSWQSSRRSSPQQTQA